MGRQFTFHFSLPLIFWILNGCSCQYQNGITFSPAGPAPSTISPTSAPQASSTTPTNCACYAVSSCSAFMTDGSGMLDLRIITPTCPAGEIYCCIPTNQNTSTTTSTARPPTPPPCGIRYNIPSNLPQGSGQARYGTYPWEGAILATNNNYIGGAVLVNDRYVLTAAHKVYNLTNTAIKVRLGEWDGVRSVEPIAVQDFSVSRITVHPNFNPNNAFNDIAVLHLTPSVVLGSVASINTACLPPSQATSYVGQNCWVSGWGKDAFDGMYQQIQKEVQVPIVASNTCQDQLRATRLGPFFGLDASFICAGGMSMKDACTGDGGSPLVCQGNNGAFTVVGLSAWGIGCGQLNIPGVYVNVAQLLPWISSQISAP